MITHRRESRCSADGWEACTYLEQRTMITLEITRSLILAPTRARDRERERTAIYQRRAQRRGRKCAANKGHRHKIQSTRLAGSGQGGARPCHALVSSNLARRTEEASRWRDATRRRPKTERRIPGEAARPHLNLTRTRTGAAIGQHR